MTTIWIDGASRSNPGPSAIAYVFEGGPRRGIKLVNEGTNNRAEYLALLESLRVAVVLKLEEVQVLSDSKLVVNQVNDEYACREPQLKILLARAKNYIRQIPQFRINLIPRAENKEADKLCNMALDGKL
jgi:ribonuclease HI